MPCALSAAPLRAPRAKRPIAAAFYECVHAMRSLASLHVTCIKSVFWHSPATTYQAGFTVKQAPRSNNLT